MAEHTDKAWTHDELVRELAAFRADLEAAHLRPNSIETYVGRATIFVRWLSGDYRPHGPIS
jgi:hypothetical protein